MLFRSPGGYTRILHLGRRRGDNSEEAILEFVDYKFTARDRGPKRESSMERARRAVSSKVETIRKDKEGDETAAAEPEKSAPGKSPKAKPAGKRSAPAKAHPKPSKEGKSKSSAGAKKGNRGQ